MTILITGGCGFVGTNLAAEAIKRGDRLVVFDNLSREGASQNLEWLKGQGPFQFIRGDIREGDAIRSVMREARPDAIFHLAGQVAMTTSIESPRLDFEVNAMGTLLLLEAVRMEAPRAAVIYSSTNKVYGDLEQFQYRETPTRYECLDHPQGFDETVPLEFQSPYGCSKGAADQYMLEYARTFKLNTVVLRHSSMYGEHQFATYDQGWVGWFCRQALDIRAGHLREPFTISGNGKQVRDVLHASDIIRLYWHVLGRLDRARGQAFNVGGGLSSSLSLLELFAFLERELDMTMTYRKLPARTSDQKVFVAHGAKAKKLLDWEPLMTSEAGVKRFLAWLRESRPRGC